jgi:hypothetical protein
MTPKMIYLGHEPSAHSSSCIVAGALCSAFALALPGTCLPDSSQLSNLTSYAARVPSPTRLIRKLHQQSTGIFHRIREVHCRKRKAGGRYAADLVLQLPACWSGSVAFHFAASFLIGSTERRVKPLHAGMVTSH